MSTEHPGPDRPRQGRAEVDVALAELARGEDVWRATGLDRRRELLARVHTLVGHHAAAWVEAAATVKGLPASSALLGEEWMAGPYAVLNATSALVETHRALASGRSPLDGVRCDRAPGGRVAVRIVPRAPSDRALLAGFRAHVWMPPGVDEETVREQAGRAQRDPAATRGVGVVLGAGNVTSIPPLDVLHELFTANRVVVLKLNPLTDPMLEVYRRVLEPLTGLGVLRILTGGADVGEYLVRHPAVRHVHLTGSAATHDAIVFGAGPDGERRRARNRPLLATGVTSELGGVSPTIVLPGAWTAAQLRFQARHVAGQRLHNGGYNCVAGQVVVLARDWPQRGEFVAALRAELQRAPARPAYYPGSDARVEAALEAYPDAQRLGPGGGRVLVPAAGPDARDVLLGTEFFAPVLGVVELPGTGVAFLDAAVETANTRIAGTLGVNVVAHPATLRELGPAFDLALARLRYGCIAVNTWTGVAFQLATASWGAFGRNRLDDVGSGIGVVHNALLLADPERTVLRGPFRPSAATFRHGEPPWAPVPPWFPGTRSAAVTGRRLTAFAAEPGLRRLAAVVASAVRG